jgi:predicted RND superfamily exporter protein
MGLKFLEERRDLLAEMGKDLNLWNLREGDWKKFRALNESHLAVTANASGNLALAKGAFTEALQIMAKLSEETKNYLGKGIYSASINLLSHVSRYPQLYQGAPLDFVSAQVQMISQSYRQTPGQSYALKFRELKLRLYLSIAKARLQLAERESIADIKNDPYFAGVEQKMPGEWKQLTVWLRSWKTFVEGT